MKALLPTIDLAREGLIHLSFKEPGGTELQRYGVTQLNVKAFCSQKLRRQRSPTWRLGTLIKSVVRALGAYNDAVPNRIDDLGAALKTFDLNVEFWVVPGRPDTDLTWLVSDALTDSSVHVYRSTSSTRFGVPKGGHSVAPIFEPLFRSVLPLSFDGTTYTKEVHAELYAQMALTMADEYTALKPIVYDEAMKRVNTFVNAVEFLDNARHNLATVCERMDPALAILETAAAGDTEMLAPISRLRHSAQIDFIAAQRAIATRLRELSKI